jgi:hypothetical protein
LKSARSFSTVILSFVKGALIAVGVLIAVVAVLLGVFVWWASVGIFSTSDFDKQKWLNSEPIGNENASACYRGGMARDIKSRVLLPGMARQEVESLLGAPKQNARPAEFQYTLGMCSGLRMDYDVLHVYFSSEGKLTHASIMQH